jgi:DNA polymerase I-like protein with 3'-5' exonuclease and polymerase domains
MSLRKTTKSHGIKEEDFTYDLIPWDIISTYGCLDTISTIRLFYKFWPIVQKNDKLLSLYTNILMPAMRYVTIDVRIGNVNNTCKAIT